MDVGSMFLTGNVIFFKHGYTDYGYNEFIDITNTR